MTLVISSGVANGIHYSISINRSPILHTKMVNWLYKPQKVEAAWIIPDPSGFNFFICHLKMSLVSHH